MRTFLAFWKKEWMELTRTGRLMILLLVFLLFGIMNPAIAKLTPGLMKIMAESLESSGLTVTEVTVDAMTSWTQFYKNIPMALLIFVLLWSSSFSGEYQKGTFTAVITKGFARWKIAAAKGMMIILTWTACYWMCFGITYGYNACFWDNRIAQHVFFAGMCYWIFGLWTLGFWLLFAPLAKSNVPALLGTGGALVLTYAAEFFPGFKSHTPMKLTDSLSLLIGSAAPEDYTLPIIFGIGISILCAAAGAICFKKTRI